MQPDDQLYRVIGPMFVAGILVHERNGQCWVYEAAWLLHRWVGRTLEGVQQECERRGWDCELVDSDLIVGCDDDGR